MLSNEEILELRKRYMLPSVFTYYSSPLQIRRASMQYVWDEKGKKYLDFFGGIVTITVGHCHPEIVSKVSEQISSLQHTTCVYLSEPMAKLAEKLAGIAPGKLQKSFFPNSGSEANEIAILLARAWTKRAFIIGLRHCYHGGTGTAMGLVGQYTWKHAVPYVYGIVHAPQPNCYRCSFGLSYPQCNIKCAYDIEELILTQTPGEIAGFIAEPVQGFGGFITPPSEYFKIVHSIIKKYGGVFIADEVQTGVGRTGKYWFGIEHWGVEPDIITMAKGFGNGAPIAGVITTDEIADSLKGKLHFSTFGGNPPQSLQALLTLQIIEREGYIKKAEEYGNYIMKGLCELKERSPFVGDVRGKGLLIGIEIVKDKEKKDYGKDEMTKIMDYTKENGVLIGRGGMYGNVIRITPPYCITTQDCDFLIESLDKAFKRLE